ncbi:SRPBCC family protein [Saccharopolyspora erythraea]|uniref:SRPBCC family protein n=1 Tax=Saccharopolyspora erythraea TaxID=1836 RepID=UPI002011DFD4|nr:SRPBCC family protein [Saccharopolyspora erythraea]
MAHRDRGAPGVVRRLPLDRLKSGVRDLLAALAERAVRALVGKAEDMADRLAESAENGGAGLLAAITGARKLAEGASPFRAALSAAFTWLAVKLRSLFGARVVHIVEHFDVGLPVRTAYDQWTRFEEFPGFTRKVIGVEQRGDTTVAWSAMIFLSRRSWEATIVEQVPDDHITWKTKGAGTRVDGTVSFHEQALGMTRVQLVLAYRPRGFLERTANLWRAQGRRVRSDFRHVKRHMMTRTILRPDEVEGWRGEIRDRKVVRTHEEAIREEAAPGARTGWSGSPRCRGRGVPAGAR